MTMTMETRPTATLVGALETAWAAIQHQHPSTPDAVIIIAAAASKNGDLKKWGHYAPARWTLSGNRVPEILISAEGLQRGARGVFETLLHEAVHGIAAVRGIKETSRGGRYHNKAFARLATDVGLVVEKHKTIGNITPDITDECAEIYWRELTVLEGALTMTRDLEGSKKIVEPGNSRNGQALICGCEVPRKIRVSNSTAEEGPILCGICHEEFHPEPDTAPAATNTDLVGFLTGDRARA